MDPRRSKAPIHRYFSGLAENVFHGRLGVTDPGVVDYIAELLVRFVHRDAIYKVRNTTGRPLVEVAEMLLEAEARLGPARREVHRHIGDFTLFWTGLYPEAVEKFQQRSTLDRYVNYREQGKRAYYIASTIPPEPPADADNDLLERLSHDFELCAYGLSEVRQEWERASADHDEEHGGPWIIN